MSEYRRGEGWWLASDGRWYPPHLSPGPIDDPPPEPSVAAPVAPDASERKSLRIAIVAGTAGMFVGVFLPWASAGPFSINGVETDDGKLFLVLAFAAALLAALEYVRLPSRGRGVAGAVLGAAATALAVFEIVDIERVADDTLFDVSAGGGLYVAAVASLVFGFGAILQIVHGSADRPDTATESGRRWWKSRWAIGVGIVVGLFVVLAVIGAIVGDDDESGSAPARTVQTV